MTIKPNRVKALNNISSDSSSLGKKELEEEEKEEEEEEEKNSKELGISTLLKVFPDIGHFTPPQWIF